MKTRISVKVRAGARRTEFVGRLANTWKLEVGAPPVDGKANDEITRFLARLTGVRISAVRIVTGLSACIKLIEIEGIDSEQLERAILESHGHRTYPGSSSPRES